jgi:hypothetical protein
MEAIVERLDRIERAVAELRGIASVNHELALRNVALTAAGAPAPVSAPAPLPFVATVTGTDRGGERVVAVRVADDTAALIANKCTYEMRDELKRAGAVWAADAPQRWVVPRAAWDERAGAWASAFHVAFAVT